MLYVQLSGKVIVVTHKGVLRSVPLSKVREVILRGGKLADDEIVMLTSEAFGLNVQAGGDDAINLIIYAGFEVGINFMYRVSPVSKALEALIEYGAKNSH